MLVQTYFPRHIAPKRYDAYLASGWFRGANMLYKTDLLCLDQDIFSVVNIRLGVKNHVYKKRHAKLLSKNDARFTYKINRLKLDSSRERLYSMQKERFKGFVHDTLVGYLYGGEPHYVFNSFEITVYDGEKMIAWSCFDLGEKSMASIIGLHDPEYAKYSLGIYTMLLELRFAKEHDLKWYYPGYVLDRPSDFDYKLSLGSYQFYNSNKRWVGWQEEERSLSESAFIKFKTMELKAACLKMTISMDLQINPYFTMAYINQYSGILEGFPMYLQYEEGEEVFHLCYDVNTALYKLHLVEPVYDLGIVSDPNTINEYDCHSIYSPYPWQVIDCLEESGEIKDVVRKMVALCTNEART